MNRRSLFGMLVAAVLGKTLPKAASPRSFPIILDPEHYHFAAGKYTPGRFRGWVQYASPESMVYHPQVSPAPVRGRMRAERRR